jgi:hypothetical protein
MAAAGHIRRLAAVASTAKATLDACLVVWSGSMALNTESDEAFQAAVSGIPKVAELIATVPAEFRATALVAAEQSYLQTARDLGYAEGTAQQWASAIMSHLRGPAR